jgi:hypothetical protein
MSDVPTEEMVKGDCELTNGIQTHHIFMLQVMGSCSNTFQHYTRMMQTVSYLLVWSFMVFPIILSNHQVRTGPQGSQGKLRSKAGSSSPG